jgi:hypothetical protein
MSDLTTLFTNIADSIRAKKGSSDTIIASDFPSEIANLPSGGGYSDLGYGIDVEAQTTINKGDKIIAIPNSEYVAPTLGATQTQTAMFSMSADNSVGIAYSGGNVQSITTGVSIDIWFRNSETGQFDTSYTITFEDYPISQRCYTSFVMNDDGTLAYVSGYVYANNVTHYDNVLIVLEIDKENKTASYRYITVSFDNLIWGGSSSADYKVLIDSLILDGRYISSNAAGSRGTNGVAIGNYIICKATAHARKVIDDTYYSIANIIVVCTYDKTTHTLSLEYYTKAGSQDVFISNLNILGNCVKINENEILFHGGQFLFKYDTQNNELSYGQSTGVNINAFSKNGRYFALATGTASLSIKIYEVSFLDLTVSLVYDKTFSNVGTTARRYAYISNDGRYVWVDSSQLFDRMTETFYSTSSVSGANHSLPSMTFDVNYFVDMYFNSTPYPCNILALTPGTDAEYLVSKYESYTGNDSAGIYGIASEDLVVGQRGEARATNTVQQKTVTITSDGTTTITPDNGYDTLGTVSVNVDTSSYYFKSDFKFGTYNLNGMWLDAIKKLPDNIEVVGTSMSRAFYNYTGLELPLLNTENITSFEYAFYKCSNIVDCPNYNTEKVMFFANAFDGCTNLVDAPSFNMSRATIIKNMFLNCSSLENVPVYNWRSVYQNSFENIFSGCSSLTNQSLNNILESAGTFSSSFLASYKTLKNMGLSQAQAQTCTTLSNWQALVDAGWTTGY